MTTDYERTKAWRLENPDKRYEQKNRYYSKTSFAEKHGRQWTEEEEKAILEKNMPDMELSVLLGRSVKAIQIRRYRLLGGEH